MACSVARWSSVSTAFAPSPPVSGLSPWPDFHVPVSPRPPPYSTASSHRQRATARAGRSLATEDQAAPRTGRDPFPRLRRPAPRRTRGASRSPRPPRGRADLPAGSEVSRWRSPAHAVPASPPSTRREPRDFDFRAATPRASAGDPVDSLVHPSGHRRGHTSKFRLNHTVPTGEPSESHADPSAHHLGYHWGTGNQLAVPGGSRSPELSVIALLERRGAASGAAGF